MNKNITSAILKFDPVAAAERPNGSRDDKMMLVLAFVYGSVKQEHLQSIGDSYYSMPFDHMLALINAEGFVKIYEKVFVDTQYPEDNNHIERYFVFFNENDGIIITLESYRNRVNNAKMYYNIDLKPDGYRNRCTSSGHFFRKENNKISTTYIGYHDIREGFRFHLNHLRENGTFLAKWVERPWLWFLTYMDTKPAEYDFKAINATVIAQFPQNVIEAISP